MTAKTAVLVVGAGPTGLTLAIELARRGQAVRIIEQNQTPFAGSRGKGLQPRTLEVFDDLGVIDRVLARSTDYPRMKAHLGPFSLPWNMMERASRTEEVPYPNPRMLGQADTEAILRARLEELGVAVEFGTKLQGFTQDLHGVTATLNGEPLQVRYLVGADGGRSFVRKALGLTLQGHTLEEPYALVGDVYLEGLDRSGWHVWPRARGGMLALCPLPDGEKFQLMVGFKPGTPEPSLDLDSVQALVTNRIGGKVRIREARWLSIYRPQARMVERYRVGNVFVAGDAAHVHPPTGGQGLNIGVQDAHNLGWKLAAALAGAPDTLLDSYQDERLPIAANVLQISTALYKNLKGRRGPEMKQLGTHYKWSALAVGEGAGVRAPDGLTRHGRLFDLFRGTHFTVLAFGEQAARMQPSDPRVRTYQLEPTRAHQPNSVVVVRPDGYIAFTSESPRAFVLDEYLARVAVSAAA